MVVLHCVSDGSKLRVRIKSNGYYNYANCQFPKNIRALGHEYEVPEHAITLCATPRGTYFYRINKKYINAGISKCAEVHVDAVYEDADSNECALCCDADKSIVFAPCGHFMTCDACAHKISDVCPMCRARIVARVERSHVL